MEDLSHKFDDCILLPLHENLSHNKVDLSDLVVILKDTNKEIGMANFKSRRNSKFNEEVKKRNYRELWKIASRKIKLLDDPWHEFRIETYPVENVIRHRYNSTKKEWRKDECVVKMEKCDFFNFKFSTQS